MGVIARALGANAFLGARNCLVGLLCVANKRKGKVRREWARRLASIGAELVVSEVASAAAAATASAEPAK